MALVLDILFVIIAAIFIMVGVKRGFIKSLIKSAKMLLTILLTYFVAPHTAAFIKDKFIFKPVYDFWYTKVDGVYQDATASLNIDGLRETIESAPKFLLADDKKEEILASLSEESGASVVESVSTSLANPVADGVSNILGYVLTFVLAFVVLTVAAWLLTKIADRIAFIGTANRILGGVFGAVMGAIVLIIAAVIIKFFVDGGEPYSETVIVKLLGDILG